MDTVIIDLRMVYAMCWLIIFLAIVVCVMVYVMHRRGPVTGAGEDITIKLAHDSPDERKTRDVLRSVLKRYKPPTFIPGVLIDGKAKWSGSEDNYKYIIMRAWQKPMDVLGTFVHEQMHYPVWLFSDEPGVDVKPLSTKWLKYIDWYKTHYDYKQYEFGKYDDTTGGSSGTIGAAIELSVCYNTDYFMKTVVKVDDSYILDPADPYLSYHKMILADMDKVRDELKPFRLDYDSIVADFTGGHLHGGARLAKHIGTGGSVSLSVRQVGGAGAVSVGDQNLMYQIASISKLITGIVCAKLITDKHLLSYDEDINGYLKNAEWQCPSRGITLKMLLTHTAGVNESEWPGFAAGEPIPVNLMVSELKSLKFDDGKRGQPSYSSGGYQIIQYVIETAVGKPFPTIVKETVFKPIGMEHSTAEPNAVNGLATTRGYRVYPETASAGMWSSAGDLALLGMDLCKSYEGKDAVVLSHDAIMSMPIVVVGDEKRGVGIFTDGEGRKFMGHSGSSVHHYTRFIVYLELGIVKVACLNFDATENYWDLTKAHGTSYEAYEKLTTFWNADVARVTGRTSSIAGKK